MPALTFSPVEEIVAETANGRLVIVADDPGRENEADLVGSASLSTPETIAFMATHGRGLICAPLTAARVEALDGALAGAADDDVELVVSGREPTTLDLGNRIMARDLYVAL